MVPDDVRDNSYTIINITVHNLKEAKRDSFQFSYYSELPPLALDRKLVIAVDPSKSNTAILIGGRDGTVYQIHEVSGAGSQIKNHEFCELLVRYMGQILHGKTVLLFGQEEVILGGGSHRSMVYLNEIRTHINQFCRDILGLDCREINNYKWKSHVLPVGYRGKGKPKGSWRWLTEKFPSWVDMSDDVTDVICIFLYMRDIYADQIPIYCDDVEEYPDGFEMHIIEESAIPQTTSRNFKLNPIYTLQQNAAYFASQSGKIGLAPIPSEMLTLDALYGSVCHLSVDSDENKLYVLVRRQVP